MALKRNERYPGRYSNPTTDHPQGAFKNRTAPSAQDGSYLEQDWTNDWDGFFGRLLTVAGITPNGDVDTAQSSQYYEALSSIFTAGVVPISKGGTGATTAPDARTALGLKDASVLNVASNADMQAGTSTVLLPTVAAVMSIFSKRSFAQNDFIRIPDVPGGLIIQWGLATNLATGVNFSTVPFPTPFPNAALIVVPARAYQYAATGAQANPTIRRITLTNFDINIGDATTVGAYWIAIGY